MSLCVLFNFFYSPITFTFLQSCADQQRVSHRLLPEVWLRDHRDKKELLQEDRACRRPRAAEEPAQSVCTAQRRASEGGVRGTALWGD